MYTNTKEFITSDGKKNLIVLFNLYLKDQVDS
jgi:hypothetical protein